MTAAEVGGRVPCAAFYVVKLVQQGKFPAPIRRLGTGRNAQYVWETAVVDFWTRTVCWTDVDGNSETGPYWRLRAKAVARGVQLPEREHSDLPSVDVHGRRLHPASECRAFTGDMINMGGQDMPDLNFLNCEPDQLTLDVAMREVDWTDSEGRRLGRKPLVDHMRDRQREYRITPSRDGLSPADAHDEPGRG